MSDILFVDDMKSPAYYGLKEGIRIARTGEAAWDIVKKRSINNPIQELWLDFDLSDTGMNGLGLLKRMTEAGIAPKKVICISYNVTGAEQIKVYCLDNEIPFEHRLMEGTNIAGSIIITDWYEELRKQKAKDGDKNEH